MMSLSRRSLLGIAASGIVSPVWAARDVLAFSGLYKSFGVRGLEFSDRVTALAGKRVSLIGYMAPPLKAESHFFVLSSEPLALCPFCDSDANWPIDIVCVYLRRSAPLTSAGARLEVSGRLDIGSWLDPESGFVSLLRLMDADFELA